MENDRFDRPDWVRLPGFGERAATGPHAAWQSAYPRDNGVRYARRVSNWTAAALIAGAAATTGYLAHSIPVTSSTSGARTSGHAKSPVVAPAGPVVQAPVVTTGGSGARGGGGGGRDN